MNSEMTYWDCQTIDVLHSWHVGHAQSKSHRFFDCGANAANIPSGSGATGVSGHSSIGVFGFWAGRLDWIFDLAYPNDNPLIEHLCAEACLGLLRTQINETVGCLSVRDCRFSGLEMRPASNLIEFGWAGPLRVEGLYLDDCRDKDIYIQLHPWGTDRPGAKAIIEGNVLMCRNIPWNFGSSSVWKPASTGTATTIRGSSSQT